MNNIEIKEGPDLSCEGWTEEPVEVRGARDWTKVIFGTDGEPLPSPSKSGTDDSAYIRAI